MVGTIFPLTTEFHISVSTQINKVADGYYVNDVDFAGKIENPG